ncbi:hypothetical protein Tco_0715926 [Tanacetum coccineum]
MKEYWYDEDETVKIFKIETYIFYYESPLCMAFNEFNYLLKVDPELFTYDIERTKNYDDYMNEFNDKFEEPWDEDGEPNSPHAVQMKMDSVMVENYREWFENFHELDYGLLEKLHDYWWKVKEHECSPFANWRNYIRGPYGNYYSNFLNVMEHEEEERSEVFDDHKRLVCNIRRFEMIKYSFADDEEYVAIKENEYDDLTNTSMEAIHAYKEIFRMMDEG